MPQQEKWESVEAFVGVDSDVILNYLTAQQHVHPHTATRDVLRKTTEVFGYCEKAIERSLEWLKIDPDGSIGRLRRSELMQLAKSVHRFWMQNAASAV